MVRQETPPHVLNRNNDSQSVTPFHAARLLLTAKTLFGRRCEKECLSTHEMNSLYSHRQQLSPGGWERDTLWRSMLEDSHDVVPGWYWFRDEDPKSLEAWLWYTATADQEDAIKAKAITLLGKIRTFPDKELFKETDVLALIASDDAAEVQTGMGTTHIHKLLLLHMIHGIRAEFKWYWHKREPVAMLEGWCFAGVVGTP